MMEDVEGKSIMLNIRTDGGTKQDRFSRKKRGAKLPDLEESIKKINDQNLGTDFGAISKTPSKKEPGKIVSKESRERRSEKATFIKTKKSDKDFVPSLFSHNPEIPNVQL